MSDQELQMKQQAASHEEAPPLMDDAALESRTRFSQQGSIPPVAAPGVAQQSASDRAFGSESNVHETAAAGVAGAGQRLPHYDQIAASFGSHAGALDQVHAHVGGPAAEASNALGAEAYAHGTNVAFKDQPSLHTAAHEATHTIQQRAGVQLKGGVGEAHDSYERNADEVADRVVAGKSAEDLIAPFAQGQQGGAHQAVQNKAVQFLGTPLGQKLPEGAEKPVYGEDHDQRRYSREQYERMWEEEQGRKLNPQERATIERGCIGITANNIAGGGNPLQYSEANFGDFDRGHKYMQMKNKELHEMRANPATKHLAPEGEYVLFAKLFWSNQAEGDNKAPDDKAFVADPKTGRMDMSGYKYKGQPGYVNFDYGFWDDSTSCFWHANHMEYKDPEKRKTNPMKVYQSTKDKFVAGYIDFDRIVFGVALAKNYDPGKAAIAHAGG